MIPSIVYCSSFIVVIHQSIIVHFINHCSFYLLHVMGTPYLILVLLGLYLWFSRRRLYPPGYPIIGNLLDFHFPGATDSVTRVQTWRKVGSCLNHDHCTSYHM